MSKQRRGYSLIEILIGLALFSLITVITFLPYRMLKKAYQLGTGRMDAAAAARLALRRMTDELCSANPLPSPTATPAVAPPAGKTYEPFVRPMLSSSKTLSGTTVYQRASVFKYRSNWQSAWPSPASSVTTLVQITYYVQQLTTIAAANPPIPTVMGDLLPTTSLSGATSGEYSLLREERDVTADYTAIPPTFAVSSTVSSLKRVIPRGIAYRNDLGGAAFYFKPMAANATSDPNPTHVTVYIGMYPDQVQRPLPVIASGLTPPLEIGSAFRAGNMGSIPW